MAIQQVLIDDLDGSTSDILTVRFAIDGRDYAIDLSPEHRAEFREVLAPYVKVARNGTHRAPVAARVAGHRRTSASSIRKWANDNGFAVGDRGRISSQIREAYDRAQQN